MCSVCPHYDDDLLHPGTITLSSIVTQAEWPSAADGTFSPVNHVKHLILCVTK